MNVFLFNVLQYAWWGFTLMIVITFGTIVALILSLLSIWPNFLASSVNKDSQHPHVIPLISSIVVYGQLHFSSLAIFITWRYCLEKLFNSGNIHVYYVGQFQTVMRIPMPYSLHRADSSIWSWNAGGSRAIVSHNAAVWNSFSTCHSLCNIFFNSKDWVLYFYLNESFWQ